MLSILINLIPALFILILILLILQKVVFKESYPKKKLLLIILGAYLLSVFSVVGLPGVNSLKFDPNVNVVPFLSIIYNFSGYLKNTVLNIILFVPLGFLLPAIWDKFNSFKNIVIIGIGTTVFIEILQLFNFRYSDIDDLIANTLGTILGLIIWKIFSDKILKLKETPINYSTKASYSEFLTIFSIVFLITFSIQPFISNVIWDIVLESPIWEMIK